MSAMCVLSMVHDHYEPLIPNIRPAPSPWRTFPYVPYVPPPLAPQPAYDMAELEKLIREWHEAAAAARTVDRLTWQPDCVAPEKAVLQQRIAELEKLLSDKPEFVLVEGAQLEPGRYRVVDGKLYKIVDGVPPGIRDGSW